MTPLTIKQEAAVTAGGSVFLEGPAGTGKTTTLHHRLLQLIEGGEPAYTLLVLVAEPEHKKPFESFIQSSDLGPYADLKITTYSQMALDMVDLFWPLIARQAGFAAPHRPPTILTYDLAQLLMWRVLEPMEEAGAFTDLHLRPQQIVSQILDTLNRAALNSLTLDEAVERQSRTWSGEKARLKHLDDAAEAARSFREICLSNSLLDLSLSVEVFDRQLVQNPEFHRYFSERFRHLIVDNIEEQTPAGQNFVSSLMDLTMTTAMALNEDSGYKRFMAADPDGARQFRNRCSSQFRFEESYLAPKEMTHLANLVENYLQHSKKPLKNAADMIAGKVNGRYRREMVTGLIPWLVEKINAGVAPSDIAIITPYLDGALRYMLTQELQSAGLPYRLLRRRSSPRDEPRVRAWLTWLALANPHWGSHPAAYDVAEALTLSIFGLDPARAELITKHLYDAAEGRLLDSAAAPAALAERVSQEMLARVDELRLWLAAGPPDDPLDTFLHDLFSRLLSQPRYQPEPDIAGAAVCDWLVKAATRLRLAAQPIGLNTNEDIGRAFITGINQGLVSANPPDLGDPPDPDGILISTIYGYLLAGQPVRLQVWLETAATGWWEIPRQPLSNAFILAQSYDPQIPWTMSEDFAVRNLLLSRIIRGLTSRCRDGIFLANSDLDRRGVRQNGPLWRALQPVIQV